MAKPLTHTITILSVVFIAMLLVYSSTISFMPHYQPYGDMWHLFVPMLLFYAVLIIIFVWHIVLMIIHKTIFKDVLTILLLSVLFFSLLNVPEGTTQIVGYFGVFAILMFTLWRIK